MKKWTGPTKQGLQWLALIAVFILAIIYWSSIVGAVGILWSVLFPIILGGMIAFVLNIPMRWFEKHLFPKSDNKYLKASRRPLAIILALLVIILAITAVVIIVIPQLASAVMTLVEVVPTLVENIQNWFNQQEALVPVLNQLTDQMNVNWSSVVSSVASGVNSIASGVAATSIAVLTTSVSAVTNIFLALMFAIYILASKEKLGKQITRSMAVYLPNDIENLLLNVLAVANETFSKFISGMVTEAVILGVLVTAGLLILQIPYAAMLGVLQGVLALIPILGAFMAGAIGVVILLALNPTYAFVYIIFVLIIQQVEGDLIYPRVVGDSVGLPSMWVLFAVTVGAGLMGIPGMLLGVPFLASIYKILKLDVRYRETLEANSANQEDTDHVKFLDSFRHHLLTNDEIDCL